MSKGTKETIQVIFYLFLLLFFCALVDRFTGTTLIPEIRNTVIESLNYGFNAVFAGLVSPVLQALISLVVRLFNTFIGVMSPILVIVFLYYLLKNVPFGKKGGGGGGGHH